MDTREHEAFGVLALNQRLEVLERQVRRLEAMQDPSNWNTTLQPDESNRFTVQVMQFTDPDTNTEDYKE